MKSLPKNYDPREAEPRWQQQWQRAKTYRWLDDQPRENTFVIDTPPPTVSGVLHMGHIFSYTQADFVARYQRMRGRDVFYPMGFDDNGLPTERLVEKVKGVRGSAMPRADFVKLCREVVVEAEEEFRRLFRSVALSVDWDQEYQTISDEVQKLSQASFIDLYNKGQAYRDFRPTYWDWVDQTAIAQAEIENKEMPGTMNDIQFALEDGTPITIATTRPELLGACVAVMYHPEDPNAKKYAGKKAITPLFGVKVPMIADEAVEREKGTGIVMCCTFGDDTDKEWWRKYREQYKLHVKIIITKSGKLCLNEQLLETAAGKELFDLKIKAAREKICELLHAEGKLLKQTQITHTVKCAERSGTPIEIISTYQWFVKIADKKDVLKAKGAECRWYPEFMKIRLNQWIDGLKEDWCISRQRFFGVPFPIWLVTKMHINEGQNDRVIKVYRDHPIAGTIDQLPFDPVADKHLLPPGFRKVTDEEKIFLSKQYADDNNFADVLRAEKNISSYDNKEIWFQKGDFAEFVAVSDVMDTWATSSITPQISARAIGGKDARYQKLFPADIRPQAHEIIRTWAFYTIVKAHLHANSIPWKNLMISGWCLAADKTKMSKSKGNVVTPVALIEEKGADAVRYWASTSRLGADTAFSEDVLKIGRKLVTKLWNASNFAAIHLSSVGTRQSAVEDMKAGLITEALDKWVLSRLHVAIKKATEEFEKFEYCDARVAIEQFFWNDFCDNYLELVKARAYGESSDANKNSAPSNPVYDIIHTATGGQRSAHHTIYHCLDALLRLFAPFVPHVTEELYSHLFEARWKEAGSVHARGLWPGVADYPYDEKSEQCGMAVVEVLNAIRKVKSEAAVSIKYPVAEVIVSKGPGGNGAGWGLISPAVIDLKDAGNVAKLGWMEPPRDPAVCIDTERGMYRVCVTLAPQAAAAAEGKPSAS